jgi:hypothetical protein
MINKRILFIFLLLTLTACNSERIEIKVKDYERINTSYPIRNYSTNSIYIKNDIYYLISTDKGIFKNSNSDIQNKIEKNNCYNIKTRFWRVTFLSMYKNIMTLDKINCKQLNK